MAKEGLRLDFTPDEVLDMVRNCAASLTGHRPEDLTTRFSNLPGNEGSVAVVHRMPNIELKIQKPE